MSTYLDPEEFPFTFDEVVTAAALWSTSAEAVELAEGLQRSARDYREARAEQGTRIGAGEASPFLKDGRLRICEFTQIEWLWPSLSILPSSSKRARAWMQFHWHFRFAMLLAGSRRRAGERAGTYKNHDLTPERRKELRETGEIRELRELTREQITPPEATVENMLEAFDALEREQAAWDGMAIKARAQYEKLRNPV